MVKKIGKLTIFLLFIPFFMLSAHQELVIRVINKNGQSVTQLSMGVPYTLQIEVAGNQNLSTITIPGLEHFYSEFCGASRIKEMSRSKTIYEYVIRADKLGSFTLGPIEVSYSNGSIVTSNVCSLEVHKNEQSPIHIELKIDEQRCYVGQRIGGTIVIDAPKEIQLVSVQIPQLDPALGKVTKASELTHSSIIKDGKRVEQYELALEFIISKAGSYKVPPIEITAAVPVKRTNSMWGFGLSYTNMQEQLFRSEEMVSFHVEPLPDPSISVHGVGNFDSFSMNADHATACVGEAVVVTLHLVGKTGVADVISLPLELPSCFKYYESKSSIQTLSNGMLKKSFEYIVQALESGDCEIPAQLFIFFDPIKKSYRRLKTQKIALSITANVKKMKPLDDRSPQEMQDVSYLPLNTDGPIIYHGMRSLSHIYFVFALLIWVLLISVYGVKKYLFLPNGYWFNNRKRVAIKALKKKLTAIKQNKNYAYLYTIFVEFFASRSDVALAEIDADRINKILKAAGFMAPALEQWNRFFQELAQQAFFNAQTDKNLMLDLLNRAYVWIDQFEEKL